MAWSWRSADGNRVVGRDALLEELWSLARRGETVLLFGRRGIGKSVVLEALRERARRDGLRVGFAPRADSLFAVTCALAEAFLPEGATVRGGRRVLRGRLRLEVERGGGLLLLDDLAKTGTALKGYLRSLQGNGLGVVLAAGVDAARTRADLRAQRLSFREREIAPLTPKAIATVLARESSRRRLRLDAADARRLVDLAEGRPGWIADACRLARDPVFWREGRLKAATVAAEIARASVGGGP